MPNYEEMMKKQQESYQRSRDPFEYGQQVARRRYSEIMSGLDAQRMSTQQSYGDLYQQARQRAVGARAAGGPTLSGGMGQQRRDFVSALELQELGKIGTAQEQAMRDLFTQGQAAFSNAQLEGQQAAQAELSQRSAALELVRTRQAIINDKNLSEAEKAQQLEALEGGTVDASVAAGEPRSFGEKFTGAALTGGATLVGGGAAGATLAGVGIGVAGAKTAAAGAAVSTIGYAAAIKGGAAAAKLAGLGVLGKFGAGIGAALAAVPGYGWAALVVIGLGSLAYAALSK